MTENAPYDLIVIGGGSAGLVAAGGAAMFGARVLLVDKREMLGGDCLNFGCVPSKALIRAARAAHELRHAERFGLDTRHAPADLAQVMAYVRGVVSHIGEHDDPERFRRLGVEVRLGQTPSFVSSHAIRLGDEELKARRFVIATGSRPAVPPVEGIEAAGYHDNETVFYQLNVLPKRLLVIGGGPIGLELGQSFARLGSQVTIAEFADRLLVKEDPEASEVLTEALKKEGLSIRLQIKVIKVRRDGDEKVVTLEDADGRQTDLWIDEILAAAGRRPNIEGLNLEAAGVLAGPRGIRVDAGMRTCVPHIFAAGDVTGRFPFTHMAEAEARIALRNALFPVPGKMDYSVVPWATFTDPEVGRVGPLESELQATGIDHKVYRFSFASADRAITESATEGFIKVLASPKGKVLGAAIVGAGAGELIHEFVLAMRHGISLPELTQTIHVYPTLMLANRRAADEFMREKVFAGIGGKLLKWWVSR